MKIAINLPNHMIKKLDQLSTELKISRDEFIERTIKEYIISYHIEGNKAFGLWKQDKIDGAVYQQNLRDEWKL